MKILIDARLYGLENAGLGRYVTNLVAGLSELDHKNDYSVLLTKKYSDISLPGNWKKVTANFRHYSISEQIKIPQIVKKENPDVVHFPHFNVPVMFRGNFVVTIHDLLMHKNVGPAATTLNPLLYLFKRMGYKTTFRKAVKESAKIIVPSFAVKKEVTDYYHINEGKVKVIYEGIDYNTEPNRVSEKYSIDTPYFVYAGNAYPHKNLIRLIEAIIQLNNNSDQKIILAVASARNIFTQRLQKQAKNAGATDFIELLGFVPDSDLGGLYKNSLGFVFPSLSEGFGLPGLEAMSAGTLVLASDIPVFKEIYKENVLYFNPFDFSSIAQAMQKVIDMTPSDRAGRIKKGKDFVKRYSWSKMAEETLKLYENEGSNSIRQGQ